MKRRLLLISLIIISCLTILSGTDTSDLSGSVNLLLDLSSESSVEIGFTKNNSFDFNTEVIQFQGPLELVPDGSNSLLYTNTINIYWKINSFKPVEIRLSAEPLITEDKSRTVPWTCILDGAEVVKDEASPIKDSDETKGGYLVYSAGRAGIGDVGYKTLELSVFASELPLDSIGSYSTTLIINSKFE